MSPREEQEKIKGEDEIKKEKRDCSNTEGGKNQHRQEKYARDLTKPGNKWCKRRTSVSHTSQITSEGNEFLLFFTQQWFGAAMLFCDGWS